MPPRLSLLLPDIRSEPIICTHPSPHVHPSLLAIHPSMHVLPHFTCCLSPSSSLLSLPDIMSSHYLHSSRCSSPSILFHFPLHLHVSHLQIQSPIIWTTPSAHPSSSTCTHSHSARSDTRSHTDLSSIWTDYLNSQQCNRDIARFKEVGSLQSPKQDTNLILR